MSVRFYRNIPTIKAMTFDHYYSELRYKNIN